MSCRAAATLTSYGDEKALFPAVSKVRSSGCVRWGRVKSGSSRKKKWKHARLQGAQRREGVCVGLGCRGPECDFADFLECRPRDLGAIGDGAPPQDVWHRLWSLDTPLQTSGICNRRNGRSGRFYHMTHHLLGASPLVVWHVRSSSMCTVAVVVIACV